MHLWYLMSNEKFKKSVIEKGSEFDNSPKSDKRTLFEIVSDMGYDWKKVKKDLAKWAGIKDYKGTLDQNLRIRKKILSGEKFQSNLDQAISVFSETKQNKIKQILGAGEFSINGVESYISNLPKEQVENLGKLSDEKFVGFIHQELVTSKQVIEKLSNVYGKEVKTANKEQVANIIVLSNVSEKLQKFMAENKQFEKYHDEAIEKTDIVFSQLQLRELNLQVREYEISNLKLTANDEEKKQKIVDMESQLLLEKKEFQNDENVILVNTTYGGSYAAAKEHVILNLTIKKIQESQEYKFLDENKKKEFGAITVELYNYNEKVVPNFNEIYLSDMRIKIDQKSREISLGNLNLSKSFVSGEKEILQNKTFNKYFTDNYVDEFVDVNQRGDEYRYNLQKLYPESKKIIQASFSGMEEYQNCFDREGNVNKKELEKQSKDKIQFFENKVMDKLKTVDKEFVGNINNLVKEQSVETCLAVLSSCMNIKFDDGTKEDMLRNFDFHSSVSNKLVVDFVGTINGKRLNLSYDMVDGKVYYQEYLYKDKETNTFKKSGLNLKTQISFVELPKLENFISSSKALDYITEMGKSDSLEEFNSNIKNKINNQVSKNIDIKYARGNFEKSILQDITMQEIFSFMGYGEDNSLSNIDPEEEPNLYRLYSIIYDSVCFYTIDELKAFRQCIKDLIEEKSEINKDYDNVNLSSDVLNSDLELNQEKLFFDLLMNEFVSKNLVNKDVRENQFLLFFECFMRDDINPPFMVIDLPKIQDYISKLDNDVNKDSDNISYRKRTDVFKKNLGRIRDNYDVLAIEKNF